MLKRYFFKCIFIGLSLGFYTHTYAAAFKVAAVEFNPKLMAFESNLPKLKMVTEEAAKNGAQLIVLPEMATTGLIYKDRNQIEPFLDTIPGKTTQVLESIAKQYHTYVVVGIAEVDRVSHLAYNSAALIGPNGYIGKYRKNGLNTLDEKWAVQGNLGCPVFKTPIGNIALLICFDSSYLEYLLLSALRGADIIAYLTSPGTLLPNDPDAFYNHSTIANITTLSDWIGTYIVASSRTGFEVNPAEQKKIYFVGGASIWDPNGRRLAQAPGSSAAKALAAQTIYAEIDPSLYHNAAKKILETRRKPTFYYSSNLAKSPVDFNASKQSKHINALVVQYTPVYLDKPKNLAKIKTLLTDNNAPSFNLIVLPLHSLLGSTKPQDMLQFAEDLQGDSVKQLAMIAKQYKSMIAFSMPEQLNGKYYSSAILLNDDGKIIGVYRKTHLNEQEATWATSGHDLSVFKTKLGRVGFIVDDEARIPDITNMMANQRADIIIIPSAWNGNYGTRISTEPSLLKLAFPQNTMTHWFNIARYAQAYTLVANYVGTDKSYLGSSALYSLNPVEAHYVPITASSDKEQGLHVSFDTLGHPDWWMTQSYLINGKRPGLYAPLTLDYNSPCFKSWREQSKDNDFCWNH